MTFLSLLFCALLAASIFMLWPIKHVVTVTSYQHESLPYRIITSPKYKYAVYLKDESVCMFNNYRLMEKFKIDGETMWYLPDSISDTTFFHQLAPIIHQSSNSLLKQIQAADSSFVNNRPNYHRVATKGSPSKLQVFSVDSTGMRGKLQERNTNYLYYVLR